MLVMAGSYFCPCTYLAYDYLTNNVRAWTSPRQGIADMTYPCTLEAFPMFEPVGNACSKVRATQQFLGTNLSHTSYYHHHCRVHCQVYGPADDRGRRREALERRGSSRGPVSTLC